MPVVHRRTMWYCTYPNCLFPGRGFFSKDAVKHHIHDKHSPHKILRTHWETVIWKEIVTPPFPSRPPTDALLCPAYLRDASGAADDVYPAIDLPQDVAPAQDLQTRRRRSRSRGSGSSLASGEVFELRGVLTTQLVQELARRLG